MTIDLKTSSSRPATFAESRACSVRPHAVAASCALAGALGAAALVSASHGGGEACRQASPQRIVELAICLDTSGSMEGLIDTARTRIWDIVSDLATATPAPRLRVALITFGNNGHQAESGWTSIDQGLTDDLDSISMKLFALRTNGGEEYVGRAVDLAAKSLAWTPGEETLKLIVIAGNESADQDRLVKYADASRTAIERGIMVNAIYCGDPSDTMAPAWREVATLADGHFAAINQNDGVVAIAAPQDSQLVALSTALNTTYLPFGAKGEWHAANQAEQDANVAAMAPSAAAQRCVAKGSELYDNRRWDLVDASRDANFDLAAIKEDALPESMRAMTLEQRRAHIEAMAAQRTSIQQQVKELNAAREQFIAAERTRLATTGPRFEDVIRDAVRAQAKSKGLQFPSDLAAR